MPIECGVDIVCVNGLSFKRYLDILVLMNKHAVVITDNDHSIEDSITRKYKDYDSGLISFFYETNEDLNTFEPSILNANSIDDKAKSLFKSIIQCEDKTDKEAIGFMQKNKTEWALRVFNSKDKIIYPQYIKDAIKKLG